MGRLVFYYGTMGCSKTANALMTNFKYHEKGKRVWLIKPAADTRDDIVDSKDNIKTLIKSRVGLSAEATALAELDNIFDIYFNFWPLHYDVIICDEAQFLTPEQVEQLKNISTITGIDVLCYGLRTDFKTKLFPGSTRLFELADKVVELDNVCECGQPAIVNARLTATGEIVTEGAQVDIGGDDKYKALCWRCYKSKINN